MEEFTIDKVGWHTSVKGNPESSDRVIDRFWSITVFLRENNLLCRALAPTRDKIDDGYSISSTDLNELGLDVVKCGYDRWLKKLNKGGPADDMEILDRCLTFCKNKGRHIV